MNTMLKRVRIPLALLSLTALAAACGGSDGGSGSVSDEVTVWMYPVIGDPEANAEYWEGLEKAYEKEYPDASLTIEQQPWDNRDEKLATAFSGGKGPDVVVLQPDQIPQYLANGALAPVDGAIKDYADKFLPAALDALSDDGKAYGAPIYHTITTTLYNKKLLDRAGIEEPPATWADIEAAAPRLKAEGLATLDYSASNEATLNLNFYPLLWQAGGKIFSEDGESVAFNDDKGVAALTFLTDLYEQGAIPKTAMTNVNVVADQALGKQQAAMGFTNSGIDFGVAEEAWGKENVIVGAPLTGEKQAAFGVPGALGINAQGNIAGAEQFITFMTRPEQIESLGKAAGFLSPRTDVTVPSDSPYVEKLQDALSVVVPGESSPIARQLMGILAPEIQAAMTGKKSPQEALDAAAGQADDLLARQR
ncbi:extracellular solute-binding protein [Streptomyces sp. CMB-StM0423]|uniref:extracellular solute-binding protein n=1 Tax=Streptomyces sp. CMB-StM0423 TaxID=2059884 RepID=UPI000C711462|nr:extracellular solute-binding protein [Streptomyces sp. CMB-StM0423]AUH42367.1 sugar ABC transporter substrate-binding protein [Streptomyces sp. CMB-StM0423]